MVEDTIVTPEKCKQALCECADIITKAHPEAVAYRTNPVSKERNPGHLLWLCHNAVELVDQGKVEKAMRWLGFVQGAMWMMGLCTIAELRTISRPDERRNSWDAFFRMYALDDPRQLIAWVEDNKTAASGIIARAAEALGKVVNPSIAMPTLLKLLEHTDRVVQEGAIIGLACQMTPEAENRLRAFADDETRHDLLREIALEELTSWEEDQCHLNT